MSFTRVKPAGWGFGEILTNAQMDALDTDHAAALDPVGGGNYNALAAPLSISGDDITLGAGTDIVTIGDGTATLIVDAATDFQQGVNASGSPSTFTTAVTVNDTFTCSANVNLGNAAGDAIAIAGTTTATAPVIMSGAGRVRQRVTSATDTNMTVGPATADMVFTVAGVLSGAKNQTIDDTGAADGDTMTFATAETTHAVTVKRPDTATLATMRFVSGEVFSITVARVAGTWRNVGYSIAL